jgi:hypothetical protein
LTRTNPQRSQQGRELVQRHRHGEVLAEVDGVDLAEAAVGAGVDADDALQRERWGFGGVAAGGKPGGGLRDGGQAVDEHLSPPAHPAGPGHRDHRFDPEDEQVGDGLRRGRTVS